MRKADQRNLNKSIKFEYLAGFFAMVIIILGAVAGEQLYPSKSTQTTESSAFEKSEIPSPTKAVQPIGFCTHYGIDEVRGTGSTLVKINSSLTGISPVKSFACSDGPCDFESMAAWDGKIYAVSNSDKKLYEINSNDGVLDDGVNLNPPLNITGLSFRKSDGMLWAWAPGKGLYTVNIDTGEIIPQLLTVFNNVEDIAWNNESTLLYLSKTPDNQLFAYNPDAESIDFVSILPGKTVALDFPPEAYATGKMIGIYRGGDGQLVYFYTYDVTAKKVITKYPIQTEYSNIDAFAVCI